VLRWLRRVLAERSGAPQSSHEALRRALLAVLDRDLPRAERLLSDAVELDSEDADAYLALGRVYRLRGELGRAIRIHQGLLLRPELGARERRAALAELGADFRQGGFLRRAIASYEDVLAQDPGDRGALGALARLYRDARDFAAAIDAERRLARIEGRDSAGLEAELLVELAEVARAEGRAADARRALKRALARDRNCVRAWIALGDADAETGRLRRALAAWRRVPEIDRAAGPAVYPRLASALAAAGRAPEHEAWLRRQLEAAPDDAGARLALARALAGRGAVDDAVAEVRAVLARQRDAIEARVALGRLLLGDHRDPDAVKEYAELLEVLERSGLLRDRDAPR
jgi:lipopolysaccharide biosynthesis regulator YciM